METYGSSVFKWQWPIPLCSNQNDSYHTSVSKSQWVIPTRIPISPTAITHHPSDILILTTWLVPRLHCSTFSGTSSAEKPEWSNSWTPQFFMFRYVDRYTFTYPRKRSYRITPLLLLRDEPRRPNGEGDARFLLYCNSMALTMVQRAPRRKNGRRAQASWHRRELSPLHETPSTVHLLRFEACRHRWTRAYLYIELDAGEVLPEPIPCSPNTPPTGPFRV